MADISLSFSPSELSSLLNNKSKRYTIKIPSNANGQGAMDNLVLQDKRSGSFSIGKVVETSSEEFRLTPWLLHRNLAAVIDEVTINDKFALFVSEYREKSLRQLISEESFVKGPNCFELKKSYIRDVLCGLDYLHKNNLCLMNLSDASVFICEQKNKAIITDFGSLIDKDNKGIFSVSLINQPPECRIDEQYDVVAAEMWVTGMLVLEVFTQHGLPWHLVDYDPDRTVEMISKVDYEILKVANSGSTLSSQDVREFKTFVDLLIDKDPKNRISARNAATAIFLQSSKNNVPLQKFQLHSTLLLNSFRNEIESPIEPSIFQRAVNFNKSRRQYRDNFKTPTSYPEKSVSNVSFKKCIYPMKQIGSDLQQYCSRPSRYQKYENMLEPGRNHNTKSNKVSNSKFGRSQKDDIKSSTKTHSKISVSSQTERPNFAFKKSASAQELKTGIPARVSSNKNPVESKDVFSGKRRFVAYRPVLKSEVPGGQTTEINHENAYDISKAAAQQIIRNSKPEVKNLSRSPFTLPDSNIPYFPKSQSTARYAPEIVPTTDSSVNDEMAPSKLKETLQGTRNYLKELQDLNKKITNMRHEIKIISDLKPLISEAMNTNYKKLPDDEKTNTIGIRNCNFQHGYRCPIHQRAQMISLLNGNSNQTENVCKDNSEIKCNSCISRQNLGLQDSNKLAEFPQGVPMPHEYWFPIRPHLDTKRSPTLSPSLLSQVSVKEVPRKDSKKTNCTPFIPTRTHFENKLSPVLSPSPLKQGSAKEACGKNTSKTDYMHYMPTRSHFGTHQSPIFPPSSLSQVSAKDASGKGTNKTDCTHCFPKRSHIDTKQSLPPGHLPPSVLNEIEKIFENQRKDAKKTDFTAHRPVSVAPDVRLPTEENAQTDNTEVPRSCHPQKVLVIREPYHKGQSFVRVEKVQTKTMKYVKKKDIQKNSKKEHQKNEECTIVGDSSDNEKKQSKTRKVLKRCFCIGK